MIIRARPQIDASAIKGILTNQYISPIRELDQGKIGDLPEGRRFFFDQGRQAIAFFLKAIGLRKGDEVIVPAFICGAVLDPIISLSGIPVVVDIDPTTFAPALSNIQHAVTQRTRAVILAHMFGQLLDIDEISKYCRKQRLYLVEDCAHCVGAKYQGRVSGSWGDAAIYSFYFDKPLSAGKGGLLIVNNQELSQACDKLWKGTPVISEEADRRYAEILLLQLLFSTREVYKPKNDIDLISWMARLPSIKQCINLFTLDKIAKDQLISETEKKIRGSFRYFRALYQKLDLTTRALRQRNRFPIYKMGCCRKAILKHQFERIKEIIEARERIARIYDDNLPEKQKRPGFGNCQHRIRYTILCNDQNEQERAIALGIKSDIEITNSNYPRPVVEGYHYKRYCKLDNGLENVKDICSRLINLPCHSQVTPKDTERILEIVKSA